MLAPLLALVALHVIPRPVSIVQGTCLVAPLLAAPPGMDPGARDELQERWNALGVGRRANGGAFYAAMTLAQLPVRSGGNWSVPCVRIEDRPALQWRILSDDVSRGPLPTMRYFEERIRTIAAFKMNGYSPYMEHVFVSPTDPLPAPLDGITPAQLHELAEYAAQFHVALIPEQQSFAHMHNTLRLERTPAQPSFPTAFCWRPTHRSPWNISRASSRKSLRRSAGRRSFTSAPTKRRRWASGRRKATCPARPLERLRRAYRCDESPDRAVGRPADAVGRRHRKRSRNHEADSERCGVVNWHYGDEKTFEPYIQTIARGGLQQMIAPGASNWNEIFPDVNAALANERRFVDQGKAAHVLGLFQTVWHDDGETLYEATWYPVIYAAAAAWQDPDLSLEDFERDYPSAFFGVDDRRYGSNVHKLALALSLLEPKGYSYGQTDALFWADPFDPPPRPKLAVDLPQVRLSAEAVEADRYFEQPPLHANAAFVMFLAARRYDVLGRKFQIAAEIRTMYADALAHAKTDPETTLRDLYWCRYWMWELRDAYEDLAPLYAQAWRYESREGHLASNLERYHLTAQKAIERADALYRVTREYVTSKSLPPLESILSS
jgi:hexosaminidase